MYKPYDVKALTLSSVTKFKLVTLYFVLDFLGYYVY